MGLMKMSTPGVEPGLSRPRRDVLTTRRCGPCLVKETLTNLTRCGFINMHTERQLEKKFGELRNEEKHFVVTFLAKLAFACSWLLASYLVD